MDCSNVGCITQTKVNLTANKTRPKVESVRATLSCSFKRQDRKPTAGVVNETIREQSVGKAEQSHITSGMTHIAHGSSHLVTETLAIYKIKKGL